MPSRESSADVPRLRCARVVRVVEDACEVWGGGRVSPVRFASMFPSPRVERVSPGHLVAIATSTSGADVEVWRWYDVVVLSHGETGSVRVWEPAHGEVIAHSRESYRVVEPGGRAYASAGLPGADWWVACGVPVPPEDPRVELDAVQALYTDNDLWPAVFEPRA